MSMTATAVLAKAADIMAERGRARSTLCDAEGHVCALGAIYIACGYEPPRSAAEENRIYRELDMGVLPLFADAVDRFAATLNTNGNRTEKVYRFSDGAQSADQVIAALRDAAELVQS